MKVKETNADLILYYKKYEKALKGWMKNNRANPDKEQYHKAIGQLMILEMVIIDLKRTL